MMSWLMGDSGKAPSGNLPSDAGENRFVFSPQTLLGTWAALLSLLAVVSWFVMPAITMAYRDVYPITDTWVMPAISVALTDAAALLGVLAVWRGHERSILNLVLLVILFLAGLFFTWMLIGEGLAGV